MGREVSYAEYKEALIILELFYAQINKKYTAINNKETKTDLKGWIQKNKMSGRLKNILWDLSTETVYENQKDYLRIDGKLVYSDLPDKIVPPIFKYLEDVRKVDFCRARNAGKKSWIDFEELRSNPKEFY